MNNKNSRTNALPGLRKKNGPTSNPSVSDSVNRGNINSNVRILSKEENEKKKKKPEVKSFITGVDGPKFYGGSAPNPIESARDIANTLYKGGKYLYNKIKS